MRTSHPFDTPAGVPRAPAAMSWSLILPLLAFLVFAVHPIGDKLLADPDTQWHVAVGEWILRHGRVPTTDPFSHSMPGAAWTAHEWAADVIMAVVWRGGGWSGLVVLAAAAFAVALAILGRFLLDRLEAPRAILVLAFAAGLLMPSLLARPHVLVWPLWALWFAGLLDAGERGRAPSWWLVPLMCVWGNLHGSFTLGWLLALPLAAEAVLTARAAGRPARYGAWLAFLAASGLATLSTPHGWGGWRFTAHVMSLDVALATIGEWRAPDLRGWHPVKIWLLVVLAAALAGRLRLSLVRVVIVVALAHLALKHARHAAALGLITPLLMAAPLARGAQDDRRRAGDVEGLDRFFAAWAAPMRTGPALAAIAVAAAVAWLGATERSRQPPANVYPEAAYRAARAAGVSGALLNSYDFGGYFIAQGVPVFIDGRADLYGDRFFARYMALHTATDPAALSPALESFGIGWTVFETQSPAVAAMDRMPGWERVHADAVSVVHRRVP